MSAPTPSHRRWRLDSADSKIIRLAPALLAAGYPLLLSAFHHIITPHAGHRGALQLTTGALLLIGALAVPAFGLLSASLPGHTIASRRLAYASIATPTAFVFLGVTQTLLGSPIPDEWVWCSLWLLAAALVLLHSDDHSNASTPALGTLRVAHGSAGVIVLLFAVFHVANHVFSLAGPETYNALMSTGGKVYRSDFAEPILVLAMLFQVFSGLYLMWRWSKVHTNIYRVVQIGSGVYLAAFILGHMNSVFVYARMHLGIPTDWAFASGGAAGLLFDSWNIRLLPHYALAILLLVVHVTSGLRVVLIAHGTHLSTANRIWKLGVAIGAASTVAVAAGLVGARL